MPTSRDPASSTVGHCSDVHHRRLVDIALGLAATGDDAPAAHVVVSADPHRRTDEPTVERHPLPPDDPVVGLLGRRAPAGACAVGLVGPGRIHPLDHARGPASGVVVHLVATLGVSVTVVAPTRRGDPPHLVGPTHEVQRGRVADACRRILGLPTAPPPPDTIDLLVDDWLERVLSASLTEPALGWGDLLACHPLLCALGLTDERWTPSMLARATRLAGQTVGWESVRASHLERDHEGGVVSRAQLSWMDVGMFARWVRDEALPRPVVLDALDANLPGPVHDRLTATLSLVSAGDDEQLHRP